MIEPIIYSPITADLIPGPIYACALLQLPCSGIAYMQLCMAINVHGCMPGRLHRRGQYMASAMHIARIYTGSSGGFAPAANAILKNIYSDSRAHMQEHNTQ